MSMTGLDAFDNTLQKSNIWLNEIMQELDSNDKHRAYLALRSVLHTLRDRLIVSEVAELGAQLPLMIRGIYYEGWKPGNKPVKERHREEFLSHVRDYFVNDPDVNPEQIVAAVLRVLDRHIASGETADIRRLLPPELRSLWPEAAATGSTVSER
jgi:uncharacterized protein (DUF2267 family)